MQHCRNEPALNYGTIAELNTNNATTDLFQLKGKIIGQTGNNGIKYRTMTQIISPMKYLSNIWRTLEIPFINCKNFLKTCYENCVINFSDKYQATTFAITDTKLCVPVMALSTEDTSELFQQLKSCFKRTINWDKYQPKCTTQAQNQYLV